MPTVMRMQGFRFVIWPDDHEPPHVHVFKAGGEVVIRLHENRVWERKGMSVREASLALDLVMTHCGFLLEQWRLLFDERC
jgi:hypothetical protein